MTRCSSSGCCTPTARSARLAKIRQGGRGLLTIGRVAMGVIRQATVSPTGKKTVMAEYFDLLDKFQAERTTQEQANTLWQCLLQYDWREKDDHGLNPDFPARVALCNEDFCAIFNEVSHATQDARGTQHMKGANDVTFRDCVEQNVGGRLEFDDVLFNPTLGNLGESVEFSNQLSKPSRRRRRHLRRGNAEGQQPHLRRPAPAGLSIAVWGRDRSLA